ncbi:MAG: nitroreductase family protein [Anaerolineales bacterium]
MEVLEAIHQKRAIREFKLTPLPAEAIRTILNAGRRAQSSKNSQPWQFVALQNREALEALARLGPFAGHLAGAALGVVIVTPDPAERWSIPFDAGQAAAYMQLAALELGIGSCLASLYDPGAARVLLGIPADFFPNVAISFGYPRGETAFKAALRPTGRTSLEKVVHWDRW